MATLQTSVSEGQNEANKDMWTNQNSRYSEHTEIPKIGYLWKEQEWTSDETFTIKYHRFVAAFTGKAYELLHEGQQLNESRYFTCHDGVFYTHHMIRGRPATFMWVNVKTEYLHPEQLKVTLMLPKKLRPVILGRNPGGYTLPGKLQVDIERLYGSKARKDVAQVLYDKRVRA